MKISFLALIIAGFGFVSCTKKGDSGNSDDMKDKMPVITFTDSTLYNFGTVAEGAVIEKTFHFKNDGKFPLIINNITSSCGCTTPEWPRDPIASQETSSILVRFNTKGKVGPQLKTVTVYANTTPAESELKIQGIVTAAADSTISKN